MVTGVPRKQSAGLAFVGSTAKKMAFQPLCNWMVCERIMSAETIWLESNQTRPSNHNPDSPQRSLVIRKETVF